MTRAAMLLVLLLAVPASASAWKEFTSAEGRFRAVVPADPKEKVVRHSTPVGTIEIRHLSYNEGATSLGVTWVDVPKVGVVFLGGTQKVFDKAEETVLDRRDGRRLSHGPVEFRGMRGREMTYEAEGRQGRTWIFLEKGRLYVVDTAVASALEGKRFLESFQVL